MSVQSNLGRRPSRQQNTSSALDLQQTSNQDSATHLSFFAAEDFKGHGDQFSGLPLTDAYNTATSGQPGAIQTQNLTDTGFFATDIPSATDHILGSPFPGNLDQQQSELADNFDNQTLIDHSLPEGPSNGNVAAPDPWNSLQDRLAMANSQSLMPPPFKKQRTDSGYSGYSTITQQHLQQHPRHSAVSVASAPVGHYSDLLTHGSLPQSSYLASAQSANPFSGINSGPSIPRSGEEVSVTSRSDTGHGNPQNGQFKNNSMRNKHLARIARPHRCDVQGCQYVEIGFATKNDLDRHRKTFHKIYYPDDRFWKCLVPGCTKQTKDWPRRDNFKAHLIRIHKLDERQAEEYIKKSEGAWEKEPSSSNNVLLSDDQVGTVQPDELHKNLNRHFARPAAFISRPSTLSDFGLPNMNAGALSGMQFDTSIDSLSALRGRVDNPGKRKLREGEPGNYLAKGNSAMQPGLLLPSGASQTFLPYNTFGVTIPGLGIPLPTKNFASRSEFGDSLDRKRTFVEDQREDLTVPKPYLDGFSGADLLAMGGGTDIDPRLTTYRYEGDDPMTEPQTGEISLDLDRETIAPDAIVAKFGNMTFADIMKLSDDQKLLFQKVLSNTPNQTSTLNESKLVQQNLSQRGAEAPKVFECSVSEDPDGNAIICSKTFPKMSELRKHERRHLKRFACTFDCHDKRFGTKHEWMRHESKQHEQHECWRCDQLDVQGACGHVFYERNEFKRHLTDNHKLDEAIVNDKTVHCRIWRKFQGQFWCGFCLDIVQNDARIGTEKVKKRYNHITSHITAGLNMSQWVPLENRRKKLLPSTREETVGESSSSSPSVIDEHLEENHDAEEDDDDEISSKLDTATSPMELSTPTSATTYKTSGSLHPSQRSFLGSIPSVRKTYLSVLNTGPLQRPRAVSDSGQNWSLSVSKFICCKCGEGPQPLKAGWTCHVCSHQLPCRTCDAIDQEGRRLRGNGTYITGTSNTSRRASKAQLDDDDMIE